MPEHTDAHMSAERLMTPPHLCRLTFLTGRLKPPVTQNFVVCFCFVPDTFYISRASFCISTSVSPPSSPPSSSFLTRSEQHFLSVFLNPLFFFFLPERSGLATPPPPPQKNPFCSVRSRRGGGGEAKRSGLRGEGAEARAEMEYDHITLTDQWRAVDCR